MKHLKKFEFYFYDAEQGAEQDAEQGQEGAEQDAEQGQEGTEFEVSYQDEEAEVENFDEDGEECEECEDGDEEVKDWNDAQTLERVKSFGSFVNEEKKFSAAQLAAKERIKGKKSDDKEDDKKAPAKKGAKPDFLDLDKDGDKKEPMKKAVADKEKKVEESIFALTNQWQAYKG